MLTAVTIPLLAGCTSRKFTRELSENLSTNIDTLNRESTALEGEQILNVWADEDGTAFFTKDTYNRDHPLMMALKQAPQEPGSFSVRKGSLTDLRKGIKQNS